MALLRGGGSAAVNKPRKLDVRHLGGEIFLVNEDISDSSALWGELFKEKERKFLRRELVTIVVSATLGHTFRILTRAIIQPEQPPPGALTKRWRQTRCVALLHGYDGKLTNAWTWAKMFSPLCQKGLSVFAVDFPGFGRSTMDGQVSVPLESWRTKDWRFICEALDQFAYDKVHFVTYGESCEACIRLLKNSPQKADREHVLLNPIVYLEDLFGLHAPSALETSEDRRLRLQECNQQFCRVLRGADIRIWVIFVKEEVEADERLQQTMQLFAEVIREDHVLINNIVITQVSHADVCAAQMGSQVPFSFLFLRRELKHALAGFFQRAHEVTPWPVKYRAAGAPEEYRPPSASRKSILPRMGFGMLHRPARKTEIARAMPIRPGARQAALDKISGGATASNAAAGSPRISMHEGSETAASVPQLPSLPWLDTGIADEEKPMGMTRASATSTGTGFFGRMTRASVSSTSFFGRSSRTAAMSTTFGGEATASVDCGFRMMRLTGLQESTSPRFQELANTARSSIAKVEQSDPKFKAPTAKMCAKAARDGGVLRDTDVGRHELLCSPIRAKMEEYKARHASDVGPKLLETAQEVLPDLREIIKHGDFNELDNFIHILESYDDNCSDDLKALLRRAVKEGDANAPAHGKHNIRPLHEAVRMRSYGVMYQLLKAKASLEAIDANMVTPLDVALEDPDAAKALELVLKEDATSERLDLFETKHRIHKEKLAREAQEARLTHKKSSHKTAFAHSSSPKAQKRSRNESLGFLDPTATGSNPLLSGDRTSMTASHSPMGRR